MKREYIHKVFSKIPIIKTERLTLRKLTPDDADDMFEYAQRADVTKYLTWFPHKDKGYTLQYLTYLETRYKAGDFYDWAVTDSTTGKMLGTCGFTRFDFYNDSAEIGYVINPDFHNKGIATEASSAIIKFGFENLALNRIECRYFPENQASLRVMNKNNMQFEGIRRKSMLIKGEYRDVGICAITRDDYYGQMQP